MAFQTLLPCLSPSNDMNGGPSYPYIVDQTPGPSPTALLITQPHRLPELIPDQLDIVAASVWRRQTKEEVRRSVIAHERLLVPASHKYQASARKLQDLQAHHYQVRGPQVALAP